MPSPSAVGRWVPSPAGALAAAMLLSLSCVPVLYRTVFTSVPDAYMHLRMGETYLRAGRISNEAFAGLFAYHDFAPKEWLFQVAAAVWHRWFGDSGWVVLASAVLALQAVAVLRTAMRRPGWRDGFSKACWAGFWLLLVIGYGDWGVRPRMVTCAMFVLFLCVLERDYERRSRAVWALPAAMAVWANAHPGWPAGLGLMAVYAVAHAYDRQGPGAGWRALVPTARLAAAGAACVAVAWLSPSASVTEGRKAFMALSDPIVRFFVMEWASPNFAEPPHLLALALLGLAVVKPSVAGRPYGFKDAALMTTLFAAGLYSARHMVFWVLAAPVVVSGVALPSASRSSPRGGARGDVALVLSATLLAAALCASGAVSHAYRVEPAATAFIRAERPLGNPYYDARLGGAFVGDLFGRYRYLDYGVATRAQMMDEINVLRADPGFERILRGYDWVMLPTDPSVGDPRYAAILPRLLHERSGEWALVYSKAGGESVFVRRNGLNRALEERFAGTPPAFPDFPGYSPRSGKGGTER